MRAVVLLILFALPCFSFAQNENHLKAYQTFRYGFNTKNFDTIYKSFAPGMQKQEAFDNLKSFLTDLRFKFGPIETYEFLAFDDDSKFASYRSDFDFSSYKVDISLDKNNLINGILVNQYKGPRKPAVVNALNFKKNHVIQAVFSKANPVLDLIFNKTKYFPNKSEFSIAIVSKGKTEYFGIIKENDSIKSIENKDKMFDISSIKHLFTASVLASLVNDNKLNLSDEINPNYPFVFNQNIKLNFKELANHTSGLPNLSSSIKSEDHFISLEDYLKNQISIKNQSSKYYTFSNLGSALLAHSLGLAEHSTFQELLQNRILTRYNMVNTKFLNENFSNNVINDSFQNNVVINNLSSENIFPSESILSNVLDLEKFAKANLDSSNAELALLQQPTFDVNSNLSVGLGWLISKDKKYTIYHTDGGQQLNSSAVALNLKNQTAIIILSNVPASDERSSNIEDLALELSKK